jgi:hypothetical protein
MLMSGDRCHANMAVLPLCARAGRRLLLLIDLTIVAG